MVAVDPAGAGEDLGEVVLRGGQDIDRERAAVGDQVFSPKSLASS
jgi:hypothetical protein